MNTVSITELGPSLANGAEKQICAIISQIWPYSPSTQKCALLLADRRGIVLVLLAGPAAQAVAHSMITVGDEVVLSLQGAKWVGATVGLFMPGKSVDAGLLFEERLLMWIRREGTEAITVNVEATPQAASLHNVTDTPTSTKIGSKRRAPPSPIERAEKKPRLFYGSEARNRFHRESVENSTLRVSGETIPNPFTSVDSTIPPVQAPIQHEFSHNELFYHGEGEKFVSQLAQQLSQEMGGFTDYEELIKKWPQSANLQNVTTGLSEASQAAFLQDPRHTANPSASPHSPMTPQLHPLHSAALPVPSPFSGDRPANPQDFTTPISVAPDGIFQFSFSRIPGKRKHVPGSSPTRDKRLRVSYDSGVYEHGWHEQGDNTPRNPSFNQELEVSGEDAQVPGPSFTTGCVREEVEGIEEGSGEIIVERRGDELDQLFPQYQGATQSSPMLESIIIDLLSDSESIVSTEEEVGGEGMVDTEEEGRSLEVEEAKFESSEPREVCQHHDGEENAELPGHQLHEEIANFSPPIEGNAILNVQPVRKTKKRPFSSLGEAAYPESKVRLVSTQSLDQTRRLGEVSKPNDHEISGITTKPSSLDDVTTIYSPLPLHIRPHVGVEQQSFPQDIVQSKGALTDVSIWDERPPSPLPTQIEISEATHQHLEETPESHLAIETEAGYCFPSTPSNYITTKEDQESFTLHPEIQSQAQESFNLNPEALVSQPPSSNDINPESWQNISASPSNFQSKQSGNDEAPTGIAIKAPEPPASRFSKGLRTPISYFTSLSSLLPYVNSSSPFDSHLDVLATVSQKSSNPRRAKRGPKHWYTQLNIVDASLASVDDNTQSIRVQCFRPYRNKLPKVEVGDVVLLRAFKVISAKTGLGVGLRSGENSAWCVWRFEQSREASKDNHTPLWAQKALEKLADLEEVTGPHVEIGAEERQEVWRLKVWWESMKKDIEKAKL